MTGGIYGENNTTPSLAKKLGFRWMNLLVNRQWVIPQIKWKYGTGISFSFWQMEKGKKARKWKKREGENSWQSGLK